MKCMDKTDRLDALLARRAAAMSPADQAATERVLANLANAPLPRQRHGWRWPNVLLDFDFAPAWPRVAALAGAAALGCAIGFFGPAARFTEGPGWTVAAAQAADTGFGAVSEPELFTGVRP
jgi:hypothetical protein